MLTQSSLSLKPELSHKGLLSQIGESTCWLFGRSLTTELYTECRQGAIADRFGVVMTVRVEVERVETALSIVNLAWLRPGQVAALSDGFL